MRALILKIISLVVFGLAVSIASANNDSDLITHRLNTVSRKSFLKRELMDWNRVLKSDMP